MTLNYNRVWTTLNELEMVTSKVCSAREILNSAIDALENHNLEKAETLMYAADEFLQYYLADFDVKFKDAWKETVVACNNDHMPPWEHSDMKYVSQYSGSTVSSCDKNDTTPECKGSWDSFLEESYYPDEYKTYKEAVSAGYEMTADGFWIPSQSSQTEDKVVKWRLPIEEVKDGDTDNIEYFITFPDDLLEAANLSPGDEVEWVEQQEVGSFVLRKVTKPLGIDEG
jgi:hypothetical protein